MRLHVVTASTNLAQATACIDTWHKAARTPIKTLIVSNGGDTGQPYLGTVPAFRHGVDQILAETDADVIACFHDDLAIDEEGWDEKVLRYFDRYPAMGLAGFGGAKGLGHWGLYDERASYDPMHLARNGFRSDLVDAEVHGIRSLLAEPVACLDGFSQIGRRAFWLGQRASNPNTDPAWQRDPRPWTVLEDLGIVHHGYDGMLGCLAARYGWQTWYIPLRCKHYGGRTAVGDVGYQAWAKTKHPEGDHGLWQDAHKIWYEAFKDVLPLRV
jgi:hypothetical protein